MYTGLLLNTFICLVGLGLHFAMKWAEARRVVPPLDAPSFVNYVKSVPAQSLVSLLGAIAVFTVMSAMGWMNPGAAFASGYLANSMAENMANRFHDMPK